jgi:hypothetical protein
MFVAFVLYTSANGFANKLYVPKREIEVKEGEDSFSVRRTTAFDTLEAAQAVLTDRTNPVQPFTTTILKNGYRAVVVDLTTGTVVYDNTVAAVPEEQSSEATA